MIIKKVFIVLKNGYPSRVYDTYQKAVDEVDREVKLYEELDWQVISKTDRWHWFKLVNDYIDDGKVAVTLGVEEMEVE